MECFYCGESEFRDSLMEQLCELPYSTVYLFRDQKYRGRCVVAFRGRHVTELFQLTKEELDGFSADVAAAARAAKIITKADKINYAIYGDLAQHVHVHIVPKKKGGPDWGGPFRMDGEKETLQEDEWAQMRTDYINHLTQAE